MQVLTSWSDLRLSYIRLLARAVIVKKHIHDVLIIGCGCGESEVSKIRHIVAHDHSTPWQ